MRLLKNFVRAIAFSVCILSMGVAAHAQYRASIQGVVTDPQGAVVSGATLTLKNLQTNQTLTATTDENGIYNFNALPPNQYSLAVEKAGFKKRVLDNRSEEHTSELQSRLHLVCRLLLEKKKRKKNQHPFIT